MDSSASDDNITRGTPSPVWANASRPQSASRKTVGTWEVHFERQPQVEEQEQTTLEIEVEELSPLAGRLVGHGASRSQARKLISEYDDTQIEVQLEALEFLLARGGESTQQTVEGG
jgi:hypothetical protein